MKIRMLKTAPGSVDGVRVSTFDEGAEYELGATNGERELAEAFVDSGFAETVDAPKATPKPANKSAAKHDNK